jgi:pyruvate/2-oxoglutarate dehydrogenase complex dihydrolipoamide dehydrogenase (E3) component
VPADPERAMHVVVLGGGSSGEHFVGAFRRLDGQARLTLLERRLVGGECSYWACMPTKTMLRPLEALAAARRAPGVVGGDLDPAAIFSWRDSVAERDDSSQVEWLASRRCELVRGDAVVTRPGALEVDGTELSYDRLVIATGSSPAIPPIPGLAELDYWTNVEATEAVERPGSLLVLGGGPVGCELAQFFARIGTQVTLVQAAERLLPRVDSEAAALVEKALRDDGVEIHLGAAVASVEDSSSAVLDSGARIGFERLLVATGRRPNTAGLEPLGLSIGRAGVEVDGRLRAAENVWAIGDVTGIAPFTHVGKYHARIAAYDLAGRPARADHRAIPATIFTDPQVATVGTLAGRISTWPLTSTPRLSTYERPKRTGFVKIAADPERRVVTGAVAVGPEAGEWLQQLTLAIRAETPIEVLLDVIQPYPTFSEAVFLCLRELNLDL